MAANKESNCTEATMQRTLLRFFLIGVVVILIGGALSLPFVYESQTLWYKLGVDKKVLRAGQLVGMLALICLIIQIFLGTRGKLLEATIGVAVLVAWHRANGIFLCCLAVLHLVLILVPEGIANLPLGTKHWPEMVGGALLLFIFSQAISSLYRQKFGIAYKQWRMVHRTIGYLALCLAAIHVLFVADSFAQGLPRFALYVVLALVFVTLFTIKISIYTRKKSRYGV